MSHHHLTKEDRLQLSSYKEAGIDQQDIAAHLGVHPSTISNEIHRNSSNDVYEPRAAHRKAHARRWKKPTKLLADQSLRADVVDKLMHYWSPQQITGRLNRAQGKTLLCHETIYRWIYRYESGLTVFLRQTRRRRYRRRYGTKQRETIREQSKKKRIDTRPTIVEKRSRLGDWEGDTIVGQEKTSRILTHVERKSGYLLADKLHIVTADGVRRMTKKRFERIAKSKRKTFTYDNGSEFQQPEDLERVLHVSVYFAYPYQSWQRGTNENTNGLLRQFFPKGSYFEPVTQRQLARAVRLINTRPRKRLAYLTPDEVFRGNCISS